VLGESLPERDGIALTIDLFPPRAACSSAEPQTSGEDGVPDGCLEASLRRRRQISTPVRGTGARLRLHGAQTWCPDLGCGSTSSSAAHPHAVERLGRAKLV
jgi:hypothetical protein